MQPLASLCTFEGKEIGKEISIVHSYLLWKPIDSLEIWNYVLSNQCSSKFSKQTLFMLGKMNKMVGINWNCQLFNDRTHLSEDPFYRVLNNKTTPILSNLPLLDHFASIWEKMKVIVCSHLALKNLILMNSVKSFK